MLIGKVGRDIFSPLSLLRNGFNIYRGWRLIGFPVHRLAVPEEAARDGRDCQIVRPGTTERSRSLETIFVRPIDYITAAVRESFVSRPCVAERLWATRKCARVIGSTATPNAGTFSVATL